MGGGLGELAAGSVGDEALRQKNLLGTIASLLPRVQDPATAGRLRALRYAPVLDEASIAQALGLPPGVAPQAGIRRRLAQPEMSFGY